MTFFYLYIGYQINGMPPDLHHFPGQITVSEKISETSQDGWIYAHLTLRFTSFQL